MTEFTGERVIPDQVNVDLWNEHVARYAFAAQYASGAQALDIGCGSGYGSAEIARTAAHVTGIDVATEAVDYARVNYPISNLRFERASADRLPFPDRSFSFITAFEVIEHLDNWQDLLAEAHRVLTEDGLFLVSTPNIHYYAESRKIDGPNPYHEHEFEFHEFQTALSALFPVVHVLIQNRSECQVFYPHGTFWPATVRLDSTGGRPDEGHFYLALCSRQPIANLSSFTYVPKAANILREREQHIAKLQGELELNQGWLHDTRTERDALLEAHTKLKAHLEDQNRWAFKLETDWKAAQERIVELQKQYAEEQQAGLTIARQYEDRLRDTEADAEAKTNWALETERRLTAEVDAHKAQIADLAHRLEQADATVEERSRWALSLRDQVEQLEARLNGARASRWVRAGRAIGVGPQL